MTDAHSLEGPSFGVNIQQAIAAGDLAAMRSLVPEAEQFLSDHGNVSASLELLRIEIARLELPGEGGSTSARLTVPTSQLRSIIDSPTDPVSSASMRPYSCAIQQAVASGELARMRATESLAIRWIAHHGDVGAALQALKIEIAKREAKKA